MKTLKTTNPQLVDVKVKMIDLKELEAIGLLKSMPYTKSPLQQREYFGTQKYMAFTECHYNYKVIVNCMGWRVNYAKLLSTGLFYITENWTLIHAEETLPYTESVIGKDEAILYRFVSTSDTNEVKAICNKDGKVLRGYEDWKLNNELESTHCATLWDTITMYDFVNDIEVPFNDSSDLNQMKLQNYFGIELEEEDSDSEEVYHICGAGGEFWIAENDNRPLFCYSNKQNRDKMFKALSEALDLFKEKIKEKNKAHNEWGTNPIFAECFAFLDFDDYDDYEELKEDLFW